MMELAVDVGNTETVIGLFPEDSLKVEHSWRFSTATPRTADELSLLIRSFLRDRGASVEEVTRIALGSVVPFQQDPLLRALAEIGSGRVYVMEGIDGLPVRLEVEEPRSVGADRIANTLAASHLFQGDTIVVDLGTATTYDCITGDGSFHGGVIAPGLLAGQEWLGGRTAKLPRVEFGPPERVIGKRTEACLQSGIFYSAIDAIDVMVDRIKEEWGRPAARVVATGGHARSLMARTRTLREVEPHLTLIGLVLAGRHQG